jgi:hypothetical protein
LADEELQPELVGQEDQQRTEQYEQEPLHARFNEIGAWRLAGSI